MSNHYRTKSRTRPILTIRILGIFLLMTASLSAQEKIRKYEQFELTLEAAVSGNPFLEVEFKGDFTYNGETKTVRGFYDGEGTFKVRFMPHLKGIWTYTTSSNINALNRQKGRFICVENTGDVHGMVRVAQQHHFAFDDGTPFYPFGTTCSF